MSNATSHSTTRYILPIPPNVKIAKTKPELAQIQNTVLDVLLHAENGGYYLKKEGGEVVAIASDRLCSVLDDSHLSLYFHLESDGEHVEAEEVLKDLRKGAIDADKLVREASDAIRGGACVVDPGIAPERDGDDHQTQDGKKGKDEL